MKVKITAEIVMHGGKFSPGAIIEVDEVRAKKLIEKGKAVVCSDVCSAVKKIRNFSGIISVFRRKNP